MDDRTKTFILEIEGLDSKTTQSQVKNNRLWVLFKGTTHVKSAKCMGLTIENSVFYAGCVLSVDPNEKYDIKDAIFMQGTHNFNI